MGHYQRAVITGATSGIGAAFAVALAPKTDLLLTGRNQRRLEVAKKRLGRDGRVIETFAADLTEEQAVHDLIQRAEAFGADLLINNAGIGHLGRVIDNDLKVERDTIALNVLAVLLLTRGLLPGMIARAHQTRRRAGLIILSSTAAAAPVPYFASYAASKAFDLSFGEALAEELRSEPVDVLTLCPGATRTAFGKRAGFTGGDLPGAADPRRVARDGLLALGRQPVKVSGRVDQAALGPWIYSRRLLTQAVGVAMAFVARRAARDESPPMSPSRGKPAPD